MIDPDCICPKIKCERHGKCDECRQYHEIKGQRTYCKRPKKSLIGSFKKIIGLE